MSKLSKKVLVTGASGFIGSQTLAPLLEKGFEVHGVGTPNKLNEKILADSVKKQVKWHACDLLDTEATNQLLDNLRATHLLHTAWYVTPGKYTEAPENKTWLEASSRLFNAFAQKGGQRIVGAGSCFEYDWTEGSNKPLKFSEIKSPRKPQSFYGQCKNELHQTLTKIPLEQNYSWGRIFYLYGPGEAPTRLVPNLIKAMKNKTPLAVWAPQLVRDYMFVRDVGSAFAALVDSNYNGPVNVASGQGIKLEAFEISLQKILHLEEGIKAEVINPPLSPTSPLELTADTKILNTEIGWSPRYDLEAGLREMI